MKRKAFSPHDDIYIQYLRNMEKHDMPVQHYHDGYEIFLMLGGKRYLFYDNICFTLERGDMAVLSHLTSIMHRAGMLNIMSGLY